MRQTVVGVFDRYAAARQAAQQLRDSGFGDSVFVTDEVGDMPDVSDSGQTRRDDGGLLAHVRQFFAGLFGADEDREASPYAEALRRGGAVVKVEVNEETQIEAARAALEAAGAVDIDERASEWRASGWNEGTSLRKEEPSSMGSNRAAESRPGRTAAGSEMPIGPSDDAVTLGSATGQVTGTSPMGAEGRSVADQESDVVPVVKEDLQVGKRSVRKGGVRVYARTVETPVTQSVELTSEHADVQRRPVDRPATEADLRNAGERVIEVSETAEEPVVAKQARVVEEVAVGKKTKKRTEQISDTVRSTEVQVEPAAEGADRESTGAATTGTSDRDFRGHFDSNYAAGGARWEEYEPAYRFGDSMRTNERYQGRTWDEIEPNLRSDWATRNTGPWERFKEAVRHGWERVTG